MEFKLITEEFERDLFVEAWEDSFKRKFEKEDRSWIFNKRNNVYAIFDEDKLVAGYCLLNNTVVYNGNVVKGALCNNVFVIQDYQGFNLFVKLGRYALKKAAEQGIEILIGMPNKNSVPGHRRVGWTLLDKNYFLEKRIMKSSTTSFNELNHNVKTLNKENYDKYKENLDKFSTRISTQRTFTILKEQNYFSWRYLERSSVNYKVFLFVEDEKVLGYIVYKLYEPLNRLHIVDVEAENEKIFYELINIVNSFKESFSLINVLGSSIYRDYFFKAGFSESTEFNNLIAFRPQTKEPVLLGDKVNIVFSDNEVF